SIGVPVSHIAAAAILLVRRVESLTPEWMSVEEQEHWAETESDPCDIIEQADIERLAKRLAASIRVHHNRKGVEDYLGNVEKKYDCELNCYAQHLFADL
ncbi:hypothetical protein KIPB_008310, partial [Kipferlia bialata]